MLSTLRKSVSALAMAGALVAVSAPAASATATGTLILFQNPDFTGSVNITQYSACGVNTQLSGQAGSFDNRPPQNCRVVLGGLTGGTFVLCAGRGIIPEAFRQSPRMFTQSIASIPCAFG